MGPIDLMQNPAYRAAYVRLHQIEKSLLRIDPFLASRIRDAITSQDLGKIINDLSKHLIILNDVERELSEIRNIIATAEAHLKIA